MAQPITRAFLKDLLAVVGLPDPVGMGARGRTLALSLDRLPALAAAQRRWEEARDDVRIGPLRVPSGELARTLARELPRLPRARLRR